MCVNSKNCIRIRTCVHFICLLQDGEQGEDMTSTSQASPIKESAGGAEEESTQTFYSKEGFVVSIGVRDLTIVCVFSHVL